MPQRRCGGASGLSATALAPALARAKSMRRSCRVFNENHRPASRGGGWREIERVGVPRRSDRHWTRWSLGDGKRSGGGSRKTSGEIAGTEFNVQFTDASSRKFLFEQVETLLSAPYAGAEAALRSTAADILEDLSAQHPLPAKIIEYRRNRQAEIDLCRFLAKIDQSRDRRPAAHQLFRKTGTATGRLSSSDPPESTKIFPIRTSWGGKIPRGIRGPSRGKILLAADYFANSNCA